MSSHPYGRPDRQGQSEIRGIDRIGRIGAALGYTIRPLPDRITVLPMIDQPGEEGVTLSRLELITAAH